MRAVDVPSQSKGTNAMRSGTSVRIERLEPRALLHAGADDAVLAIDIGGAGLVDSHGHTWGADAHFSGGNVATKDAPIAGTDDDVLYQTRRWAKSFSYALPLTDGSYTLKLHFVEMYYTSSGKRTFNVSAEGKQLLSNFDIYAAAGKDAAHVRSFDVQVTGGSLNVQFNGVIGDAIIAGLEVFAAPASQPTDEIVIDNSQATLVGAWSTSSYVSGFHGSNYLHDGNTGKGSKSVAYTPDIGAAGWYEVQVWYPASKDRNLAVPFDVNHAGGTTTVPVNQRINGSQWFGIGAFEFGAGTEGNVRIRTTGTSTFVLADAVRFTRLTAPVAPMDLSAASVSGTSIKIRWADMSSNEGGFTIERKGPADADFIEIATVGRDVVGYLDESLDSGSSYSYRVRAVNAAGNSSYTNIATATPVTPTSFTQMSWTSSNVAKLPTLRPEAQRAVVGEKLYVFGGFQQSPFGPVARMDVYNPTNNTWTRLPDAPHRITHAGVAYDDRFIYMAGGYIEKIANPTTNSQFSQQIFGTKEVWRFDTVTQQWTRLLDLPDPRGTGALVLLGRTLYFFGGDTGEGTTSGLPPRTNVGTHWSLNLDEPSSTWTSRASLPNARNHMGYVALRGQVWAIGGQFGNDESLVTTPLVHAYDPMTNSWTPKASLPRGRSHISSSTFVFEGRIFTMGGESAHGTAINDVSAYDPDNDRWTDLNDLPINSASGIAEVINGVWYYAGGWSIHTMYKGMPVR